MSRRLYLIDGVPEGYADGTALKYSESDPNFVEDFGIDPGCKSASITAVPPVRERELAEALSPGQRPAYSICSANYDAALGSIAQSILAAL